MITTVDVEAAEYIIDRSGAVDILQTGRRRDRRGRKPNDNTLRLYLVGTLLCIMRNGNAVLTDVLRTLTEQISLTDQLRLGIRREVNTPAGTAYPAVLTYSQLTYVSKTLTADLDYGPGVDGLDPAERERRRGVLQHACDAILDVFDLGWRTRTFAIDATGVWSWGRGRTPNTTDPAPADTRPEHNEPDTTPVPADEDAYPLSA